MSTYNGWERQIARLLDSMPRLRSFAKTTYQYSNYRLFRDSTFDQEVPPNVEIQRPSDYYGLDKSPSTLFFGYFDKSPWTSDMDRAVFHHIRSDGKVDILTVDSQGFNRIATSSAWNYQQGSMTQWRPGTDNEVIFNDKRDGKLVARIVSTQTGTESVLPTPIQTVHPDGDVALAINYPRLDQFRPEYGYGHSVTNFDSDQKLDRDGVWKLDLQSGERDLIVSIEDLTERSPRGEMANADHVVNHALYSPTGNRIVFMHRWIGPEGKFSRLYTANTDGSDLTLLMDDRIVSHYCWRSDNELVVWGRTEEHGDQYYLVDVMSKTCEPLSKELESYGDGHPSLSPSGQWLVTDTYPDRARQRHLVLYDFEKDESMEIGRFLAPWAFRDGNRCDLHPRWSADESYISVDSTHTGKRQSYFIDVSAITQ